MSLSSDDPQTLYPKPAFSLVEAGGGIVEGEALAFGDISLDVNPGLVTIIGGRGTGKSILLDCLYKRFHDPANVGDDNRLEKLISTLDKVIFEVSPKIPMHTVMRSSAY